MSISVGLNWYLNGTRILSKRRYYYTCFFHFALRAVQKLRSNDSINGIFNGIITDLSLTGSYILHCQNFINGKVFLWLRMIFHDVRIFMFSSLYIAKNNVGVTGLDLTPNLTPRVPEKMVYF